MENIKEEFEKRNNTRDWFVEGGRVDHDTPEKYVYDDFTTDMCWTCFFDAYNTQRLRADTAEANFNRCNGLYYECQKERDTLRSDLAAAEQRIAELVEFLTTATMPIVDDEKFCIERILVFDNAKSYLSSLNPNPEAESHE